MRSFRRNTEHWEIELHGATVVTRGYDDGVLREADETAYASPLRAKWERDRLCLRWLQDGFERAGGDSEGIALGNDDFRAALLADPDELETYLVYADWLAERGDPWGELISAQCARDQLPRVGSRQARDGLDRTIVTLLFRHSPRFWGRLGETVVDEDTQRYACDLVDAEWTWGFVRSARIAHNTNVPAPCALIFTELPRLDITMLLEQLTVTGDAIDDSVIAGLVAETWPRLQRLRIDTDGSFHSRGAPFSLTQLAPILAGERMPALRALDLAGTRDSDDFCDQLSRSALASSLRVLRLERASVTAHGIEALANTRFAALERLEVSAAELPASTTETLRHLAPHVRAITL